MKSRWDWIASGLVMTLALTAAVRLASTDWTGYLYLGETAALLGVLLGFALGVSNFRPWPVRGLAFAYTILYVPVQLTTLSQTGLPIRDKLGEIWLRVSTAWVTFQHGQKLDDPILFLAFIVPAFWLVGLVSGYGLTRHRNALTSILPSAFAIVIVQFYDPLPKTRLWQVAFYLLLVLLLIGRLYFLENREGWQARRVLQLPETQGDFTNGLLISAVILILVTWNLPLSLSSWKEATQAWKNLTRPFEHLRKDVERAIDPLESPYGERKGGDFYGEELQLGRGLPLSTNLMFRVYVPEDIQNPPPRFYWRGRVFTTFNGNQWINPTANRDTLEPEAGDLTVPNADGREVAEFEIVNAIEQSILYSPSQPIWSSIPTELLYAPGADPDMDLVAMRALTPIPARSSYHIRAALSNPSIEDLRAAGETYPEWVMARYLQLPANFPTRIADLAQEITADQTTPYDKALAITLWLRTNIAYQAIIPAPPQNANALEWVLFEYKRGFCMYYATSEVLMLRSLGIPARMAVGFAEGELDEETNSYLVRRQQYHAWPEVYFPDIGWVEFEPTASQNDIARPLTNEVAAIATAGPRPQTTQIPEATPVPLPLPAEGQAGVTSLAFSRGPLLWGLFLLFVLALWQLDRRTGWVSRIPVEFEARAERQGAQAPRWIRIWAAWTRLSPVARSFESVNLSLRMLGDPQPFHATPAERAARLSEILPRVQPRVLALTEQHAGALYAGIDSNASAARRHGLAILFAAMWARLLQLGRALEERFSRPDSFR